MGGKEERTSEVGRARARVERREAAGEARFDIDPGPTADELLHGRARRRRRVSRKPGETK